MKKFLNVLLIGIIVILLITVWGAVSRRSKTSHHSVHVSRVTHLNKHKPTVNHENYGDKIIHQYHINKHNYLFRHGFNDGNNAGGVETHWLTIRYRNDYMYKKGWIIGDANHDDFDLRRNNMTLKNIEHANYLYNKSGNAIQKGKKDGALEKGQIQLSGNKWDD